MLRSSTRFALLALVANLLTGCTPSPAYQGIDMSAHNPVALAPVCVGQFALDFPRDGVATWHVNFDWAAVERLPARLHDAAGFWAHVHARRDALAAQSHDTEPSLLSYYEQVGESAALLLHRNIPINKRVYYPERYLWLGDRGYLFKGLGEGEEIKAKLPAYKRIFSRLQPLNTVDQQGGFCIDGAVVKAEVKIDASHTVEVRGFDSTTFTVGTVEANETSELMTLPASEAWMFSAAGQLDVALQEFKLLRADPNIRDMFDSPKELSILRNGQRTVADRQGEEAVWMMRFNNGSIQYKFMWTRADGRPSLHGSPGLTFQFSAGDPLNPDAKLPAEQALLGLWDAVLDSVHKR